MNGYVIGTALFLQFGLIVGAYWSLVCHGLKLEILGDVAEDKQRQIEVLTRDAADTESQIEQLEDLQIEQSKKLRYHKEMIQALMSDAVDSAESLLHIASQVAVNLNELDSRIEAIDEELDDFFNGGSCGAPPGEPIPGSEEIILFGTLIEPDEHPFKGHSETNDDNFNGEGYRVS